MHTLSTRDDLLPSDENIKGVAELGVSRAGHGVKWANLQEHARRMFVYPDSHTHLSMACCYAVPVS